MPPIRKLLRGALRAFLVLVPLAIVILAVVLSHEKACPAAPASASGPDAMHAVVRRCYGGPEVLELARVTRPALEPGHVLVKVKAAGINPYEWHFMRGTPYLMRIDSGIGAPKEARLGVDFAGVVEAVGAGVTGFAPGDEVFGGKGGALAEYVTVKGDRNVVAKPENVSFEQAASVNIAGVTALQALRDRGQLKSGQRVLINGASGGVGTFAVQIAKAYGAHVTGVCSTRNLELVRGLGADQVIDYTREDYTRGSEPYDLIVDMVGSRGLLENRRVLKPDGRLVIIGGPDGNWLGPLAAPLRALLLDPFVSQHMGMMMSRMEPKDLAELRDLMAAGKVTPVIDRTYPLAEVAEAVRYLETGRARGKVVVTF